MKPIIAALKKRALWALLAAVALALAVALVTVGIRRLPRVPTSPTSTSAPPAPPAPPPHKLGLTPGQGWFFYTAGTSGTYTVPTGAYVTGLSCHATGAGATLTMTPSGPSVTSPVTGPAIPIPAGGAYTLSKPLLAGNSNELGAGTILVFVATDTYAVTLTQVGGP